MSAALYRLLRAMARVALSWYYGSVEVSGLERVPVRGPVFLAGNHPNALIDALVIGVLVPRRLRILAKATLFRNPLAARLLHGLGVIPLQRAKDVGVEGAPATTPTGSEPTDQVPAAPTPDPDRNADAFAAVTRALGDGAAVLIFPEGISHDAPQLAPLRTGLARMARAAREAGVRDVTIVPLGLVFEAKEVPRSRVLLQVGDPLALDTFAPDGATVPALTAEIDRRLRAVTLNFATEDEATRITSLAHALAVLLAPVRTVGQRTHKLADVVRLTRRIARASARLEEARRTETPLAAALAERALAFEQRFLTFRARLDAEGLALEDVRIDPGGPAGVRFVVRESARALVLGPVGLWGRLNHWLPLRLTRWLALRETRSRDEPAMRSVVLGFVLVLGFYALQVGAVAAVGGPWWALLYGLTLVPSAGQDLRSGDRWRHARARARAYRRFRREPALQAALVAEATWLREEAGRLEAAL